MGTFGPNEYGRPVAELLAEERLPPLGPGTPNEAARAKLAAITVEELFGGRTVRDRDMARCCLAGLWLYHDLLDASHGISQEIGTTTGSYWHGIMHRREPDYANAKYWFGRVGRHPVFDPLRDAAATLAEAHPRVAGATAAADARVRRLATQLDWDPLAFVDLCEEAARRRPSTEGPSSLETLCRHVQRREWELLFDYCWREAVGQ